MNIWLGLSAVEKKFNSFAEGTFTVFAEMVHSVTSLPSPLGGGGFLLLVILGENIHPSAPSHQPQPSALPKTPSEEPSPGGLGKDWQEVLLSMLGPSGVIHT